LLNYAEGTLFGKCSFCLEIVKRDQRAKNKSKGGLIMSPNSGLKNLKYVLMLYIVANLFYGVFFLFLPGVLVSMSGVPEPVNLGWIRWAGGPLIALGIGAIQVYRNPSKQGIFVTIAAISGLLIGLGLLYSKIFDHSTAYTWFHMTPCVIYLVLFVLLLWARQGAKDILDRK
jgi:hypothetical protein